MTTNRLLAVFAAAIISLTIYVPIAA